MVGRSVGEDVGVLVGADDQVEEHGQIRVSLPNLALQTAPYFHSGSGSLQNVHLTSLLGSSG